MPAVSRRHKLAVRAGLSAVCLLALLLLGHEIRLHAGRFLICSDTPQPADLILVIGGDFYGPRVLTGAELAVQGYAPLVLISGPPYQQDRSEAEFAIDFLAAQGYPRHLFQAFAHRADSTITEAIALRDELDKRHVKRVILVTSSYHSRRADIVFRLFCPGIHFASRPAPDSHYDPDHWWTDTGSRQLFFSECKKIIGSLFIAYPEYLLGLPTLNNR